MKQKNYILFVLSLFCAMVTNASESTAELQKLDQIVISRSGYYAQKREKIQELQNKLAQMANPLERYLMCSTIIEESRAFDTNLQLLYAQEKYSMAEMIGDAKSKQEALLNLVEVEYVTGMYMEAFVNLQKIKVQNLPDYLIPYYYHVLRTYYGLCADNSMLQTERDEHTQKMRAYRDSVLLYNSKNPFVTSVVLSDKYGDEHQYDKALKVLNDYMASNEPNVHERAVVYYCYSDVYGQKGDKENQKLYLAKSASADIQSAVREYVSLHKLARLLYDDGDIARAYEYMKCSLEDATACNARLRTIEVSNVFPIVEQAYRVEKNRQRNWFIFTIVAVSILSLGLLALLLSFFRQKNKLSNTQRILSKRNEELKQSNEELQQVARKLVESNRIKEDYLGQYMDLCLGYIETLESYRKQISKASRSGIEKVNEILADDKFLETEWENFYDNFDVTFLNLFPDFIEQMNNLLIPDGRIHPKRPNHLNTELRIYALIRLGISDSVKIAHFLRYSVTTIYNYRTRIRNNAIGERNDFEQAVMRIGQE